MTAPQYDSGELEILGWAAQPTSGTPVAAAHYVGGETGSFDYTEDDAREDADIMSGSGNQTVAIVDGQGDGSFSFSSRFFPVLNYDYLTGNCGFGSTLGIPALHTLSGSGLQGARQLPDCRVSSLRVQASAAGVRWMAGGVFGYTSVPISALSAPSLSGQDPYTWQDSIGVTLATGASSAHDVQSIDMTISYIWNKGYGDGATRLPNIRIFGGWKIAGTLVLFLNDTNIAEYNASVAPNGIAGGLTWGFDKVITGSKRTVFTHPHVKYSKAKLTYPKGGVDLVTLPFRSFSPTLANQLSIVQTTDS